MVDFKFIRPMFGGTLSQSQVDGINAIIAAHKRWGDGNPNTLAYALATATWETGHAMQPIYERGAKSYFAKYEPGTAIGKKLGNTLAGDGYRFRGTGLVQLTGRRNFAFWAKRLGVDLVSHPEMALQPDIAARILIEGMKIGAFTGAAVGKYIDDLDENDAEDLREYKEARRVVNGTDRDDEIAAMAIKYEKALRSPGLVSQQPVSPTTSGVTPTLPTGLPKVKNVRTIGVLAAIVAALAPLFAKLFGWGS